MCAKWFWLDGSNSDMVAQRRKFAWIQLQKQTNTSVEMYYSYIEIFDPSRVHFGNSNHDDDAWRFFLCPVDKDLETGGGLRD